MKYKVNLQETSEGYAVSAPGLPGCWSQGKTEKEALENIKEVIQLCLEHMAEEGSPIPENYSLEQVEVALS